MPEPTHISPRMLIRDLVRRHPAAIRVLYQHGIDPTYAHLSIELAARASHRNPQALLASLREELQSAA